MEEKKRLIYPDILRIVSIFGVIVLHCVGELWDQIPIKSKGWVALVAIDSLFRFAVPVFVMVSGMFMLSPSKNRGIKKLYSKNILRIVTSFAFWSIVYLLYHQASDFIVNRGSFKPDFRSVLNSFFAGEYHLWFMYMIAGLYIVTPILCRLVEKKSTMQYFLMIWFIFCMAQNFIYLVPGIGKYAFGFMNLFKISIAVEYSGYYVLGYYLHNYEIEKPLKVSVNILACLSTFGIVAVTIFTSFRSNELVTKYLEYLLPMTALQSVAVFLCIKNKFQDFNPSKKAQKAIYTLSKISFGVYLSHLLVIKIAKKMCLSFFSFPTCITFGIMLIAALILSPLISYILNKIPILNKYIV